MLRLTLLAVLASHILTASTFSFQITPSLNGVLYGAPGSTLDYGYIIENPDPNLYLMTTNFTSGTFDYADVSSLFDFPIVGPGQMVNGDLFEIQLHSSAPPGFINSG